MVPLPESLFVPPGGGGRVDGRPDLRLALAGASDGGRHLSPCVGCVPDGFGGGDDDGGIGTTVSAVTVAAAVSAPVPVRVVVPFADEPCRPL